MSRIKYTLEDIKSLTRKFNEVKKAGADMIRELKEVIHEKSEIITLIDSLERKLQLRFFDLLFTVQIEINSTKIDSAIGLLRTYLEDGSAPIPLDNMEFTFDDGGNIQLKDDLYILTTEVFPYYFLSKLTDYILSQRIVIRPLAS